MTDRDLILRFVTNFKSFYSLDLVVECTGLDPEVVKSYFKSLVMCDVIRRISKHEQIYVTQRSANTLKICTIHSRNWVYNLKDCQDIAALLKCTRVKTIREIARLLNRSRQWVYMYLEALISVEVIGINESGYYTKNFANIYQVGSVIKKGIINELRVACGIKPDRKSIPKPKSKVKVKAKAKSRTKQTVSKQRSLRRTEQTAGI
jgi:predicted transcriptional regulator